MEAELLRAEEAVRREPESVRRWIELGVRCERAGRDHDAAEAFWRACSLAPRDPVARGHLRRRWKHRPEMVPLERIDLEGWMSAEIGKALKAGDHPRKRALRIVKGSFDRWRVAAAYAAAWEEGEMPQGFRGNVRIRLFAGGIPVKRSVRLDYHGYVALMRRLIAEGRRQQANFRALGSDKFAAQERREIAVIEEYLPDPVRAEIAAQGREEGSPA